MIYTADMSPMSCSSCYCLVSPGEQVTSYTEYAGTQPRQRAHHDSYADCQSALARESLRYARIPVASADGRRHYTVRQDAGRN